MPDRAADWLEALQGLATDTPVRIMNVCGGHERSISVAGLRTVIPDNVELVPGPGCPVCICPEEDVYEAIQIALHEDVTLVAFGDMLRVPVNVPKREPRSLEQAKAAGADIRPGRRHSPRCLANRGGAHCQRGPLTSRRVFCGRLRDDDSSRGFHAG
jgi:hydrogenase expression/formation protein HypD